MQELSIGRQLSFIVLKVSVVIPAYNEALALPETLAAITKALSVVSCPSEIIVVDNDSLDGTKRVALAAGANVVPEQEHNIAKVRNSGAKNSTGDVLVFIDADTLVPETLFQKIIDVMEDEKCFGGAVAVEYEDFERTWMRFYLAGWKFWVSFSKWHRARHSSAANLFLKNSKVTTQRSLWAKIFSFTGDLLNTPGETRAMFISLNVRPSGLPRVDLTK